MEISKNYKLGAVLTALERVSSRSYSRLTQETERKSMFLDDRECSRSGLPLTLWYVISLLYIQVAIMDQTKDNAKITDKYRASTEVALALWSSSRIDLVEGNSALTIPVETDQAILDAFDELKGYSEKIIADIDALLDPISGVPRKLTDPIVVDELLELIGLSFEFLKRMNAV
jgi:hypothetical protein